MTERREVAVEDRPGRGARPAAPATPVDAAPAATAPVDPAEAPIDGAAPEPLPASDSDTSVPRNDASSARTTTGDEEFSPLRSALSVVTTLGPPITIIAALMHYFGWSRADVQASAMGVDVTMFGYSPQDYIIRSVSTLYVPLLLTGTVALGWLSLHRWIEARGRTVGPGRHPLRRAGWIVLAVGLLAALGSVTVAMVDDDRGPVFTPLVLAVGTAVAAYGSWLVRAWSAAPVVIPVWQRALRGLLTGAVITLALFWQMSNYAGIVGRGYVHQLVDTVPNLPRVWAYSSSPLGIEAPGVREELIPPEGVAAEGDALQYRTSGLRLLTRSGGRLFLLHDGWTPQTGTVVLLPDDGSIRWQFSN